MKYGLSESNINKIINVFSSYEEVEEAILYGSRAKGNYKPASDIDLCIIGQLDYSQLLKLENELDDLLLPYKMDISLKHKIDNRDLIDHINRVGKTFYQRTTNKING